MICFDHIHPPTLLRHTLNSYTHNVSCPVEQKHCKNNYITLNIFPFKHGWFTSTYTHREDRLFLFQQWTRSSHHRLWMELCPLAHFSVLEFGLVELTQVYACCHNHWVYMRICLVMSRRCFLAFIHILWVLYTFFLLFCIHPWGLGGGRYVSSVLNLCRHSCSTPELVVYSLLAQILSLKT